MGKYYSISVWWNWWLSDFQWHEHCQPADWKDRLLALSGFFGFSANHFSTSSINDKQNVLPECSWTETKSVFLLWFLCCSKIYWTMDSFFRQWSSGKMCWMKNEENQLELNNWRNLLEDNWNNDAEKESGWLRHQCSHQWRCIGQREISPFGRDRSSFFNTPRDRNDCQKMIKRLINWRLYCWAFSWLFDGRSWRC